MANVYEALQRGRREGGRLATPLPRLAKPSPATFAVEMRALAARLQPLLDDRKPVTLAITASGSGEGTSTIARELAYHMAGEGKSVLFCGDPADIDAVSQGGPVVEPKLRVLGETNRRGLTLVDISDLQRRDSGFGRKAAFRDWLVDHSGDFDLVIIDVPPVLQQQSWSGFMAVPDGVIMVVEAERTRSEVLKATTAVIEEANGHLLGVVFNKRRRYIPKGLYRWL